MEAARHTIRRLLAAALGATVVASGCALMSPTVERYQPPPMGSTWTSMQRNTGSFGRDAQVQISRGEANWQGRPVMTFSMSPGPLVMATPDSGSWIALVGRDGKPIVSWDPPFGWVYPLHVGRTFSGSYRLTIHAAGRTIPFDASCKVESYEDVTVPAGTFKTFRIPCSNTLGDEQLYWYAPDLGIFIKTDLKRGPNHPFGPGTQQTELVSQTVRK